MEWIKNDKSKRKVNGLLPLCLFCFLPLSVSAQQLLCLDSCRAMALRNNKQLGVAALKQDVAANIRKAARTKYLPHVSAIGTYQYTSEEISLLNNEQKASLPNLGTTASTAMQGMLPGIQSQIGQLGQMLGQLGVPAETFQQMAGGLQQQMQQTLTNTAGVLNTEGQKIVDAFRTDTRNVFAGSIMVTQPVFMGGAIIAMNKLADLNEEMASYSSDARRQTVIYSTDQIYWQVVSLKHKKRLAEGYLDLIKKLDSDVQKMIQEGVATRSDGLSVSVKVNEAEMMLQKVDDGLTLSKMLLCQTIGLPLNTQVTLVDEDAESLAAVTLQPQVEMETAIAQRPELKMLENSVGMANEVTNIMRAGHFPQVALMGGYAVSNPNVLNGFEKKFGGFWNVGVLVRIPIWNWGDVTYKVRASKGAAAIAQLELTEAREKIELQVNQTSFKVSEANKRLVLAQASIQRADENLRTANLGFAEGVITPTTVMEAQTAWLQAQSQKIDAEIDVKLSQVDLQKAMGTLY